MFNQLFLPALLIAVLAGGTLAAQPQLALSFNGTPVPHGGSVQQNAGQGFTLPMNPFTITNAGTSNLNLTLPYTTLITFSNVVNCSVSVGQNPYYFIAPGNDTTFTISLTTPDAGPFSFDVAIASDDPVNNPFVFTVNGTVQSQKKSTSGATSDGGCSTAPGTPWLISAAFLAAALIVTRGLVPLLRSR
ncbi:MAG: hypothetical protein IT464_11010 [Planctomycetes bacterium]|nr:hypothetical protein [Planctomycetota bacterium]